MCISFQEILYLLNNKQTFKADSVLFKPFYIVYGCPKIIYTKSPPPRQQMCSGEGAVSLKGTFESPAYLCFLQCSEHPYS